jgi:hypothetical protein
MKYKFPLLLTVILSFSLNSEANGEPEKVPGIFNEGPAVISAIKLKTDEVAVLVLSENVMGLLSSAALAGSCESVEGKYAIVINADGVVNKTETNFVTVTGTGNSESFVLNATLETPDAFRGQVINVRQTKSSKLKRALISEYSGAATVNRELTLLSMQSKVKVTGQNNSLNSYQNLLFKHFYVEQKPDKKSKYILGWGLASLSTAEFPNSTFWVQFKALKVNGLLNRVLLQQDQLKGNSACRIVLDSAADTKVGNEKNLPSNLVFKGTVTITRSQANEDLPEINKF